MPWNKPYPLIDEDTAPFYDGAKQHKFMMFHCKVCGAWYWPKAYCRNHHNESNFAGMEWAEASGKGKVFTFGIVHEVFHPGFKDDVPYVFGMAEMEEGPMFGTRIVGCDPYDVKIGMPVEVCYEDVPDEGFSIPYLRPAKK